MIRALIVPSRDHFGPPLLIDANIAVYLMMVFSGIGVVSFEIDDLIRWGANYGPLVHGLGYFRLISAQFVHAGLFHLAGNLYGLLIVSYFLAPVALNTRLIALYLLTGLGGSILSHVMHPDIASVGASGAVFGLCGVLLALVGLRDPRYAGATRMVLTNIGVLIVLNLAIGAATPGIDNAAHIGGLATGLALGVVLRLVDRNRQEPAQG